LVDNFYSFSCPHCKIGILVHKNEVSCRIFRCGEYKSTGNAISPHASKEECQRLVSEGAIRGCGGPFTFNGTTVQICDYI
jgi:hypothetical protein